MFWVDLDERQDFCILLPLSDFQEIIINNEKIISKNKR